MGILALSLLAALTGEADRVEFSNHGCYGSCPVYDATIFSDGRVHYRGLRFVHTYGDRWHQVSSRRARRLIRRVARFTGEPPTIGATDQVETTTVAHLEGRTVSVDNDHGWRRTATAMRASRIERRVRRVVKARKYAKGPVGCRDRSLAAQLDARSQNTANEQALFEQITAWLAEHPQTKVELWVTSPEPQLAKSRASLDTIERALAATGIGEERIAWSQVVTDDASEDGAEHTVFLRGAPARCTVPPPER